MTQPPQAPRIVSAALPPGYTPEDEGEPQVLLFFRIYSGLVSFSGLVIALYCVYHLVQNRKEFSEATAWFLFSGMGTLGFFSHLLGVLAPRRPWMHVVGIIILGLGLVSSCFGWIVNLPLLLYWLRPEVKRWFETTPTD